jgi:NAD(P)-dependent dehydrogenase (short-subunit alcohol dehydrogenase family)
MSNAMNDKPLSGLTCAITGPTRGIGLATAQALADQGARMILLCRHSEEGEAVAQQLAARGATTSVVPFDLGSLQSVAEAAVQVRELAPRLDVLINNAGVFNQKRRVTVDGFEEMFGINFLGHFLLTQRLMPLLAAAPAARLVHLTSNTHWIPRGFDFDDYNWERRRFFSMRAYGHSKLAINLFNRAMARRLANTNIVSNCCHPGVVATGMGTDVPLIGPLLTRLVRPFFLTIEQGAATSIYLAASPDATAHRGQYFVNSRPARASRFACDDDAAERLYRLGETLLASRGFGAIGAAA